MPRPGFHLVILCLCACFRGAPAQAADAVVHDPRLQLTLFASDPVVVTPVGLAIDAHNDIFVLESHTHSPPRDYRGPKSDRIKIFHDIDRDGRPDAVTVFADGIEDGMNLAFSPAGELFVVTSRAVFALHDKDGVAGSESRTKVLDLVTPEKPYDHAALLSIAFSHDGWMYVSRGNTGSLRYTIKGTDGSSVGNFGDGGNIVRCRPDGSKLQEVATGFWNPFGMAFDRFGRLLCVDNDPDARGPNRLVQVIPGGDYGYKSMYGGGGNHPYQAWNGELPGTLPIAAGLGEAPCGVIDASTAALPPDYRDCALATIWGEHNITRCRLKPRGVSIAADTQILIQGDQDFRPVAIAADRRGILYFADWVNRDYPNHGRGRIWRLAAKAGEQTLKPTRPFDPPQRDPGVSRLAELDSSDYPALEKALTSGDPFERSAAVNRLAHPEFRQRVLSATAHENPDIRLGTLLALRRAYHDHPEPIARTFLTDPDPRVRRMALVWIGERPLDSLRDDIAKAISTPEVSATLFETYLATSECLTPQFVQALRQAGRTKANTLPRNLDPAIVESIVRDAAAPPTLRALALTRLPSPHAPANFAVLTRLLSDPGPRLRLEAVRTLGQAAHDDADDVLTSVVNDQSQPPDVRAEALLALSFQSGDPSRGVLPLLDDKEMPLRIEAARVLRAFASEPPIRAALSATLQAVERHPGSTRLAEQIRFALRAPEPARPNTLEKWRETLATGGDPASGRRVFQSAALGCARCHTVDNRGGRIGPDLSNIAQSLDRPRLIRAIVKPSDEYSIDYQAWFIKTKDGDTHLGLQLDLKDEGAIELFTLDTKTSHFKGRDIAAYGALKQSIMPEGLEAGMSVGDFRDLIAYLESLK